MNDVFPISADKVAAARWPRLWRLTIIGLGVLILCSCQAAAPVPPCDLSGVKSDGYAMLPRQAFTGVPEMAAAGVPNGPPGMERGVPMPYTPTGPWSPPGIATPWPADEYLRDGGHQGSPVQVSSRGELHGLQMEDTVAQFETLDGHTYAQASNPVYVYSPRFGAVRQVVNLDDQIQIERLSSLHEPVKLVAPVTVQLVGSSQQDVESRSRIAAQPPVAFRGKQGFGAVSTAVGPRGFQDAFKAYENLAIIRQGILSEAETAFLARGSEAALAWSKKQAVQVVLDRQAAMEEKSGKKLQSVYTIDAAPAHPRLRVVKVASTPFAQPGDEVDFTIRFDNVGNRVIGNVAIIDSLSTRLEYIANSAQCSREAQFSTQPNEGDSLLVRCELTDPLKPGQGGVIRFHCHVR
jgi:uncharacterized repeat protein (TIGR01451 family)